MSQPTRQSTTREATQRAVYGDDYRGKLHIDPKKLDRQHFEYKWAAETVLGEPQAENITDNLERDWIAVPADKYPELVPKTLEGMAKPAGNYIRRGGQILMMRPKEIGEAELKAFQQYNRQIEAAVDKDRQGDGRNIQTTREIAEATVARGRFEDA